MQLSPDGCIIIIGRGDGNLVGRDFYYNGKCLSDFNFVMVLPDENDTSGMEREILKGEMNAYRPEANHYGTKYTEPIKLNFKVMTGDCNGISMIDTTYQKFREFQAWLTSKSVPYPLIMEFDKGEPTEYLGIFTNVKPATYHGLNGISFTFTCSSPFAYITQGITTTSEENSSTNNKTVFCDSDEEGYIYPTIEISNISGKEFTILNLTDDDHRMSLTLDMSYNKYVIDCKYKRILADDEVKTLTDVGWTVENVTDYNNVNTGIYKAYWLRITPGLNRFMITCDADCSITFKSPIKIGGYIDV